MIPWRPLTAVLLVVAGLGAIVRSADASLLGRVGGSFAALALVLVAGGILRERNWAYGAGFLLGICWFWATVALRVQGVLSGMETTLWLAWSVTVIFATVHGRTIEDE